MSKPVNVNRRIQLQSAWTNLLTIEQPVSYNFHPNSPIFMAPWRLNLYFVPFQN